MKIGMVYYTGQKGEVKFTSKSVVHDIFGFGPLRSSTIHRLCELLKLSNVEIDSFF